MTTFERMRKLLATGLALDAAEITPEYSVAEQTAEASLEMVELAVSLEREFGITLGPVELAQAVTVQDLVELVEARQGDRTSS